MRSLLCIAAGAALTLAMPAVAQTTGAHPQSASPNAATPNTASPNAAGSQASNPGQILTREKVKQELEQAGFRNVQVMPESFLVRAQNKDGQPMMMIINPDSVTAMTAVAHSGGSGSSAGSSNGSGGSAAK